MTQRDSQILFNYKQGWLAKTGSNNRGWRERYFILSDGKLSYYKSEKEDTALGYIDLKECFEVTRTNGRKGFGLDLQVPGRVYNLSLKSEEEQDDWITAINLSLDTARKLYGDPSPVGNDSLGSKKRFSGGSLLGRRKPRSDSISSIEQDMDSISSTQSHYKDPVLNSLLEAEVDALRSKTSQLEHDLESAQTQRHQLQQRLDEKKVDYEDKLKHYGEEITILKNQVDSLEKTKSQLEAVNDSLCVQVQEKDELISTLEQQMTDEVRELDDEVRNLQEDLTRSKERQQDLEEDYRQSQQTNSESEDMLKELRQENNKLKENFEIEKTQRQRAEEQLRQATEVWHKLEVTERERDRLKAVVSNLEQKQQNNNVSSEDDLKAERLQLQVEMENLRNSMSDEIESTRKVHEHERQDLSCQLEKMRKEQDDLTTSLETRNREIQDSNRQIVELRENVVTLEERTKQLQIEKEKAVSDIITMRKLLKEKEKKTSMDEETTHHSNAKLAEAENRAEMATRLLQEIQSERDSLRSQLKRQNSPQPSRAMTNGTDTDGVDSFSISPVMFRGKSQPTTAMSVLDVPPPKPKRPSKEVLNKLTF